jgi:hypothetical protein
MLLVIWPAVFLVELTQENDEYLQLWGEPICCEVETLEMERDRYKSSIAP